MYYSLLSERYHFSKRTEIRNSLFADSPPSTYSSHLYLKAINFRYKFKESCMNTTHSLIFDPFYVCYMVRNCLLNPLCFIIVAFRVNLYILVSFRRFSGICPWTVPFETRIFTLFLLYFIIPISSTIFNHAPNINLIDFCCWMLIPTFTVSYSSRCTSTPNSVCRNGDIFNGKCVLLKHLLN
jgi:hypothetical protein